MRKLLAACTTALFVLLCSFTVAASPVGFSRACRLADLPSTTRTIIANVFRQTLNGVPVNQLSATQNQFTYAFESITADYTLAPLAPAGAPVSQYFLWAQSWRYTYDVTRGYFSEVFEWPESALYPGSAWDTNRGVMMSARSGSGQTLSQIWMAMPQNTALSYYEYGDHQVFRPLSFEHIELATSRAKDCNCQTFGFSHSIVGLLPDVLGIAADKFFANFFLCN